MSDSPEDETAPTTTDPATKKRPRGFAAMTPEQRRLCGARGGQTAHERGTANRFTSESASAAGRVPHERGTAYRWTSEEAAAAGRKSKGIPRPRRKRAADGKTDRATKES